MHMAQRMPLPLTVSCFSEIQVGFSFLVPAYRGSPGQTAVKRLCVCVTYLHTSQPAGICPTKMSIYRGESEPSTKTRGSCSPHESATTQTTSRSVRPFSRGPTGTQTTGTAVTIGRIGVPAMRPNERRQPGERQLLQQLRICHNKDGDTTLQM